MDLLLGHLHDLLAVRKVIVDLWMLVGEHGDVLQGQALVGWDGDVPDVGPVDALLLAVDLVLQEVDRDLVYRGEQKG